MNEIKERLDIILKDDGYFESREKAQIAVKQGLVKVCGVVCKTPSKKFVKDNKLKIEISNTANRYVSRGALKLEKAINYFNITLKDKIAIDVGASTGGFSDVMLQNGIDKIYCVDVGTNQLHPKIRNSQKIVVYEKTDFRDIRKENVKDVSFVTVDVSFISLEKIIPKINELFSKEKIEIVCLVKPQFECGKEIAKKYKGVIKDKRVHQLVLNKIISCWENFGFRVKGLTTSPITGGDGNIEYLMYIFNNTNSNNNDENEINIENEIKKAFLKR